MRQVVMRKLGWLATVVVAVFGLLTIIASGGGGGGNDPPPQVTVDEVQVSPTPVSIAKGTAQQFTATALLSDGTTVDVTELADWASSAPATATVSNTSPTKGRATGVNNSATPVTITATLDSVPGTAMLTVTPAVITQIQVTAPESELAKGLTQQYTATAIFSDGTNQNLTVDPNLNWTSTVPSVATISNVMASKGRATAVNPGSTLIRGTFTPPGGGAPIFGSKSLTVTNAALTSIQITPASAVLPKGGFTQQFTATGIYTDSSTPNITNDVVWASSALPAAGIASISNAAGSKGLATSGANAGGTNITAAMSGVTSSPVTLTVTDDTLQSIEIDATGSDSFAPATMLSRALGRSLNFTATGVFGPGMTTPNQDLTKHVTWASSNLAVATISNATATKGRSVTQGVGISDISATLGTVDSEVELTVTSAELVSIQISADSSDLPRGFQRQFEAMGSYTDGSVDDVTEDVTWTSEDSNIATISNVSGSKGLARGGAVGSTNIVAVLNTGASIVESNAAPLNVTDASLVSIMVTPDNTNIPQSTTQQFLADGTFSDGSHLDLSKQVSWSSSDSNVAIISNVAGSQGVATAVAQGGPVTITATRIPGGVTGSAFLTVSGAVLEAIRIVPKSDGCPAADDFFNPDPELAVVPKDFTRRLLACALFSDDFVSNVTAQASWLSQATDVVTVGDTAATKGRVAAVGRDGEVGVVQATFNGHTDTFRIEVLEANLTGITISADKATTQPPGTVINFTALGTFSDGSMGVNVTENVTWNSSQVSVATISNTDGTRGQATVQPAGGPIPPPPTQTNITATRSGTPTSNTIVVTRGP